MTSREIPIQQMRLFKEAVEHTELRSNCAITLMIDPQEKHPNQARAMAATTIAKFQIMAYGMWFDITKASLDDMIYSCEMAVKDVLQGIEHPGVYSKISPKVVADEAQTSDRLLDWQKIYGSPHVR